MLIFFRREGGREGEKGATAWERREANVRNEKEGKHVVVDRSKDCLNGAGGLSTFFIEEKREEGIDGMESKGRQRKRAGCSCAS